MASDSEDESFVDIGKPLPFLEGDGKAKPITLQDAPRRAEKEAKGRPRFHGAFTGGFSAGYFNTVGTKEGWTPSTFVSSRQQKQESTTQQPEDFMDEEDLGEHGIAPRRFATSDAFSSEAQSRKRKAEVMSSTRDSILPASAALTDLIVPERLPIGIRLLRKMGWKEGQGIGPRVKVKKKKKRKQNLAPGVKIYGCSLPPGSDEEESDPSNLDLQNVTFAPQDVTPITFTSKDNAHGLGYRGLDPRSALPGSHVSLFEAPAPVRSTKGRKGIRGQAFGVGALEDEDEDIYSTDSLSNYDQTMELDDSEQLFGWTAPGARTGKGKTDQQKVPVSYVGKLLEGFSLSAKPLPPKKVFPAPTLPAGFHPFHRFKKTAQQLAQEAVGETSGNERGVTGQQKLNAVERGLVLGETPIASSVFDLIPKEDIRKLEAVKEAAKMTAASLFHSASMASDSNNSSPALRPTASSVAEQTSVQATEKPELSAGEKGEQPPLFGGGGKGVSPFVKDPAKQARYDRYLALVKQGVKEPYSEVCPSHMTEWERQREREEFSKAATIYRPLATMMASRFTRGTFIDDAQQLPSGLSEAVAEKSEQAKAAEMKMFGRLTREEMEWHPHNVLCKRFNIPNPYPESTTVGVPGLKRDKFSVFNFLTVPSQQSTSASRTTDAPQDTSKARDVSNSLTMELNASKRKKGALSIFSVLEEEEKTPRKPLHVLSLEENTDSANDTDNKAANDEERKDEKEEEDTKDDDDDGRSKDLFRAIFKNSDSESSSASEKLDSEKSDDDDDDLDDKRKEGEKDDASAIAQNSVDREVTSNTTDFRPQHSSHQPPSSSNHHPPPLSTTLSPSSPPGPPPPLPPSTPSTVPTPTFTHPRSRKTSRWGVGSIFDVLDQSPPRTSTCQEAEKEGDSGSKGEERLSPSVSSSVGEAEMYGPALPPPRMTGTSTTTVTVSVDVGFPSTTHRKHKHKHREQDHDSSKHRHKKEKKKKSKHKKDKKKKKKSRRSHHEHSSKQSSGSEADSDTDSDT